MSVLNNLNINPQTLGLLSTGLSLLEGQPFGQSIQTGITNFAALDKLDEDQKRRALLAQLIGGGVNQSTMTPANTTITPTIQTPSGLEEFVKLPEIKSNAPAVIDTPTGQSMPPLRLSAQQRQIAALLPAEKQYEFIASQLLDGPKVYGDPQKGMYTYEINPDTGRREIAQVVPPQGIGSGPFTGSGIASQDSNILLTIGPRISSNDPTLTKVEKDAYSLSYARMSKPQRYQVPDGQGGMMMVEQPPLDLSAFPAPTGVSPSQAVDEKPNFKNKRLGGGTIIGRKPSAREIKNIDSIKNAEKMLGNLNRYRLSLRDAGGLDLVSGAVGLPSDKATDLSAKAEALRLDLKNLYELGALVGGDFQILDNLLTNPNTVTGIGVEVFGSLETQLDSLETQLRQDMQAKGYRLAGTEKTPIIATNPQEFEDAPIGTYVLVVDEETGERRLKFKR